MDYEQLFLSQIELIDRVIAFVARRRRLTADEAEEFGSIVRLKLIENDYDVLRRFQHRSSLQTYLTVVIQRLLLDYRVALWGKWRPSAEARRAGPVAVHLETLLVRDGLTFDEACEVLKTHRDVALTRADLSALSLQLPVRNRRRFVGEEALDEVPGAASDVERGVLQAEQQELMRRLREALDRALSERDPQDRLILQMRFEHGLSVAQTAEAMHLDQKALYRRIDRLLRDLRRALEANGFDARDVVELIGQVEWPSGPAGHGDAATRRPSMSEGARLGD